MVTKHWRRQAIKKEKAFQRNIWIALALLFVAFLAEMEAINFLLAIPTGLWVAFHAYRLERKVHQWAGEKINQSFPPFLMHMLNLLLVFTNIPVYGFFTVLVGIAAIYGSYSLLNALFISP